MPVRRSVKTLAAAAADGKPRYEPVYLPVELICAQLLVNDLTLSHSVAHRVLFLAPVQRRLLAELDGQRSCWHLGRLAARRTGRTTDERSCGTVFFWGITDRGRRVPMSLIEDSKALLLAGIDDRGETIVDDFRPESWLAWALLRLRL